MTVASQAKSNTPALVCTCTEGSIRRRGSCPAPLACKLGKSLPTSTASAGATKWTRATVAVLKGAKVQDDVGVVDALAHTAAPEVQRVDRAESRSGDGVGGSQNRCTSGCLETTPSTCAGRTAVRTRAAQVSSHVQDKAAGAPEGLSEEDCGARAERYGESEGVPPWGPSARE